MDGLEAFSGGYAAAEFRAEIMEDGPVLSQQAVDFIVNEIYEEPTPPWMAAETPGEPHFPVAGDASIPPDVIGLPEDWMDALDLEDDYRPRLFFVADGQFAKMMTEHQKLISKVE